MKSIMAVALAASACGMSASAFGPAQSVEAAPHAAAEEPGPDAVQWRAHCDLEDGRRFITDGSLLLESRYVPDAAVPEKSVAPPGVERLLKSQTDHEFGLADLEKKADGGHYVAPGGIQLNRKYIELLRSSPLKGTLRLRGKGRNDAVLILDGKTVVGVMMPMKS
jgi:hypothetical protein